MHRSEKSIDGILLLRISHSIHTRHSIPASRNRQTNLPRISAIILRVPWCSSRSAAEKMFIRHSRTEADGKHNLVNPVNPVKDNALLLCVMVWGIWVCVYFIYISCISCPSLLNIVFASLPEKLGAFCGYFLSSSISQGRRQPIPTERSAPIFCIWFVSYIFDLCSLILPYYGYRIQRVSTLITDSLCPILSIFHDNLTWQ